MSLTVQDNLIRRIVKQGAALYVAIPPAAQQALGLKKHDYVHMAISGSVLLLRRVATEQVFAPNLKGG